MIAYLRKRGYNPLFLSILFHHLFFTCSSQETKNFANDLDLYFAKKHIGFTIKPLFIERAVITKNMDKYEIQSTPLIGFEVGVNNYLHLNKATSVIVGLFFGAYPRNLNYSIPGNEFIPPINGFITTNGAASREFNFTVNIPVLFVLILTCKTIRIF